MGINIGLDIGIASVGLAVVDSDTGNVLETVADLFNCAEVSENVKRREFRQARRLKRRQHTRLEDFTDSESSYITSDKRFASLCSAASGFFE